MDTHHPHPNTNTNTKIRSSKINIVPAIARLKYQAQLHIASQGLSITRQDIYTEPSSQNFQTGSRIGSNHSLAERTGSYLWYGKAVLCQGGG